MTTTFNGTSITCQAVVVVAYGLTQKSDSSLMSSSVSGEKCIKFDSAVFKLSFTLWYPACSSADARIGLRLKSPSEPLSRRITKPGLTTIMSLTEESRQSTMFSCTGLTDPHSPDAPNPHSPTLRTIQAWPTQSYFRS
jgi:hypothetical protein